MTSGREPGTTPRDRPVRFVRDDRAVSVQVNYTLSLAIITVMIAGLFMGMSTFLQNERESAVQSEFDVLGNRVAADLAVADRLNQSAWSDATVRVATTVPEQVAGQGYEITIVSSSVGSPVKYYDVTIYLESNGLSVNRSVSVRTRSKVEPGSISGNNYVIVYDESDQQLEVRNGD